MEPSLFPAIDAGASVLLDYPPMRGLLLLAIGRALDKVGELFPDQYPDQYNEAYQTILEQTRWECFIRPEWFASLTKEERRGLLGHLDYDVRTAARAAIVGMKGVSR